MLYILFLLLAGILQGLMVSLNGQLYAYFDPFVIVFLVHFIPTIILLIYLKCICHQTIFVKTAMPKYVFLVGFIGVYMVASSSYCTAHIGAVATSCLITAGNMAGSTLIDHFGFFGVSKKKVSLSQAPCYLLVLLGIILIVTA